MKKIILSVLLAGALQIVSQAQGNEFIFTWQIAAPGEELRKIVDKTSFQGWGFEYRYALTNTLTVGGALTWNIFHQEIDKSTWQFENTTITSRNWRYTHVVPVSVNFHFNPLHNQGARVQVFAGGGIGGNYVNQEVWAGLYTFRHEKWNFHAYPEVGLRYVMSTQTALFLSGQFMYIPGASFTGNDLTYWNIRLGFSFGTHRWK